MSLSLPIRVSIALIAAAAAFLLIAGRADAADISCVIRNNGAGSRNTCTISVSRARPLRPDTIQINRTRVRNGISIVAVTGGNSADKNTTDEGDVDVDSGNVTVNVTISNSLGGNFITP